MNGWMLWRVFMAKPKEFLKIWALETLKEKRKFLLKPMGVTQFPTDTSTHKNLPPTLEV